MICRNCGCENADSYKFCENCGAPLKAAPGAQREAYRENERQPEPEHFRADFIYGPGRVLAAVKGALSSPLALTACILYSLYIVLYAADSFTFNVSAYSDILNYYSLSVGTAYTFQLYGTAVSIIPMLFIAIGLWITYAGAADKRYPGMPTSGLTMIKTITIIRLIFVCLIIIAVPFIVFVLLMLPDDWIYYDSRAYGGGMEGPGGSMYVSGTGAAVLIGILVLLLAFLILIIVLEIVYMAKCIRTAGTISRTIRTATASDKVSGFVAVMNFITAALVIFATFTMRDDILSLIVNLLGAAIYIIFGVLIFSYRERIRRVMPDPV